MAMEAQAGGPGRGAPGAVAAHAVLLLGACGGEPVPTPEHPHKTLFHASRAVKGLGAAARFEASEAGPRSSEASGALRELAASGLAARGPGGYALTAAGRAEFSRASAAAGAALDVTADMKSFFNPMSRDELLAMSYFVEGDGIPCVRSGPEYERVSRSRRELADAMHRGGRLGINLAARVAGVLLEDYMDAERARGWRTEWDADLEPLGSLQ